VQGRRDAAVAVAMVDPGAGAQRAKRRAGLSVCVTSCQCWRAAEVGAICVHDEDLHPAAATGRVERDLRVRAQDDREGREGLGLGLYIVREIARAHGGEVDVRSGREETVFTVYLPRKQPSGGARSSDLTPPAW
jgi:hypothetical protein